MRKPIIIRNLKSVKRTNIKVLRLEPVYTYADPKEKERMERSINRNNRRKKKWVYH